MKSVEELVIEAKKGSNISRERNFKKLYEQYHNNSIVAYEYASSLDSNGKEEKAIPIYKEAIDQKIQMPFKIMCEIQLGSSLRVVGKMDESKEILENVLEKTSDPAALMFLILTLYNSKELDDAFCHIFNYFLKKKEGLVTNYYSALKEYMKIFICKNGTIL
jgi:cyanophycin synthetase